MDSFDLLACAARVAVGLVFLWAATAKMRAFRSFVEGLARAFPSRWARPVAYSVISVELTVGILLVSQVLTRIAALTAVGILSLFTAFLVLNVARGSVVPCNCFGMGSGKIIGTTDILRNIGLVALAAYGALRPTGVPATWLPDAVAGTAADFLHHPAGLLILAALAVQTLMIGFMLRPLQNRDPKQDEPRQHSTRVDLPIDFKLPNFVLQDRDGAQHIFLDLVSHSTTTLFIFIGVACHDCAKLLTEIADLETRFMKSIVVVVSGRGPVDAGIQRFANVMFEEEPSLARFLGLVRTPSSILFDSEGRVSSFVQAGSTEVERQVRAFAGSVESRRTSNGQRPEPVAARLARASEGYGSDQKAL